VQVLCTLSGLTWLQERVAPLLIMLLRAQYDAYHALEGIGPLSDMSDLLTIVPRQQKSISARIVLRARGAILFCMLFLQTRPELD
jgi:hypothetical protein